MSEDELERSLRQRLERESLESLIGAGVQVSDAEVEREFRRRTEQLRLEYVLADAARYRAAVAPTDDEVKARFEAKREATRSPRSACCPTCCSTAPTLQPQVAVTDRELELYYNDHREEFRQEEEACASHILVKVKQGDAAEGHTDAEAPRRSRRRRSTSSRRAPTSPTLAKKVSEDTGSAAQGGDLGCFAAGPHGARVRRRGLRARTRAQRASS